MSTVLNELLNAFADSSVDCAESTRDLVEEEVPQPYRDLLVHRNHMTVALENWYGSPVEVVVLKEHLNEPYYGRVIQLRLAGTDRVVEYGTMRIDLSVCGAEARDKILAHAAPLGRVLIEHGLLMDLAYESFLEVRPQSPLASLLGATETEPFYGRLAAIHAKGNRVVHLLEILPHDVEKR